jgi:hypothetical protein
MTRFREASADLRKASPLAGSLPPCGGGLGRGVAASSHAAIGTQASPSTPLISPRFEDWSTMCP